MAIHPTLIQASATRKTMCVIKLIVILHREGLEVDLEALLDCL
jgi:hypothetical protein